MSTAETPPSASALTAVLNNPRYRSLLAGGAGGLIGWAVAEAISLATAGPATFIGTAVMGLLVGAGIGLSLGMAEGLVIRNWAQVRRGAGIGLAVGALGGVLGAAVAQGISRAGGGGGNAFSSEMAERLKEAGATAGTIEVGLSWQNTNDIDLHVEDPSGEYIYFDHRRSASGGALDVDRNANCRDLTNKPVEHIVWTADNPPEGEYRVYVHHYANCGSKDPTHFVVQIKTGQRVTTVEGDVKFQDARQLVATFSYPPSTSVLGPILSAIGWALFGALVGSAQGLSRGSVQALRNAALGGGIGGLAGGLLFEGIAAAGAGDVVSRLVGFVILGACIGLCIVLVEQALSAILWITSGRYEGRQIFLDRPLMRMGRSDALEVFLGDDAAIVSHHATIRRDGKRHVITAEGGAVTVNGAPVQHVPLADGDRIQIGKTRFRYGRREDGAAAPAAGVGTPTGGAKSPPPPPPPPPPPLKKAPSK